MRLAFTAAIVTTLISCNDPVDYGCKPIAAGEPGCIGGPSWTDRDGDHQDATDETFPVGCTAQIPEKNDPLWGGLSFECMQGLTGRFYWEEAL